MSLESLIFLFVGSIKLIILISIVAVLSFKLVVAQSIKYVVDFILHWFAICLAILLTIQLILLWIGFFGYWEFLLVSISLLGLILVRTKGKAQALKFSFPSLGSARKKIHTQYTSIMKSAPSYVLFIVVSTIYVLIITFKNVLLPPTSGDALAYHLPMAAQWLRQGSILAHDTRVWFYPGNSELMLTFFMLPFHADFIVSISDTVYLCVVALSMACLIKLLGGSFCTGVLGGTLLVTTPLFLRTLGKLGSDLFLAMVFVLGLYFVFYAARIKEAKLSIGLSIVFIAILFGTKYIGAAYAFVLAICAVMMWSRSIWGVVLKQMPYVIGIILLLGGTYYFRNFILLGNPVYPIGINFGPLSFPAGDLSHLVASVRGISEEELRHSSLLTCGQLDTAFFSLGYHALRLSWGSISLFAIMIGTLIKRKHLSTVIGYGKLIILVALLSASVIFLMTPMSAENIPGTLNQISRGASLRFGLTAFALLTIFNATNIALQTNKTNKWLLLIILTNLISLTFRSFYVFILTILVTLIILLTYRLISSGRIDLSAFQIDLRNKKMIVTALIGFIVIFSVMLSAMATIHQTLRLSVYTYGGETTVIEWLDQQAKGSTLLVSIGIRNYPFFGSQLENRVIALGLSQTLEEWASLIDQVNPDYVVVSREKGDRNSPTFGLFPEQENLFVTKSENFQMVYSDQFVHVYSVIH
jgi:hypothetical protein